MISEMAKQILSEGAPEVEEQTVIFLEAGNESFVFRLFRARESDEDPEQQAIQWLGLAKALCQSARGELTTGLIQSRDEEAVMDVASGREIEAREWPQKESTDRRELSATQVAR